MKLLFIFFQTGLFFFGTSSLSYSQEKTYLDSITFTQKDKIWSIKETFDSIQLFRDTFCIQFESLKYNEKMNLHYAMQIAAITEDSSLKYMVAGQKIENVPYFSPGTGLAAEDTGYSNLFIDNEAHHYITYESEKERRADRLWQYGDILGLEWCIPQAYYKGEDLSFTKLPFRHIYLVFFNDKNLNSIIDAGEFKIVSVTFY